MSEDLDAALVGDDRAEQHQQRRGLARAVRPEERDAFAGVDDDVDAVDGLDVFELLAQAARFEDCPHALSLTDERRRITVEIRRSSTRVVAHLARRSLPCDLHQPLHSSEVAAETPPVGTFLCWPLENRGNSPIA